MKIRPVRHELFHVGRQTERNMTKLAVAFRKLAKAPKTNV